GLVLPAAAHEVVNERLRAVEAHVHEVQYPAGGTRPEWQGCVHRLTDSRRELVQGRPATRWTRKGPHGQPRSPGSLPRSSTWRRGATTAWWRRSLRRGGTSPPD